METVPGGVYRGTVLPGSGRMIRTYDLGYEGTVAFSDRAARDGHTYPPKSHAASLGCPVCHGFPWGLLAALGGGEDAFRLNATVRIGVYRPQVVV